MEVSFPGVGFVHEVILRLFEFRVGDDIAVEQSLTVVLVALHRSLGFGHDGLRFLLVARLFWAYWGHIHVASHGRHAWAHIAHLALVAHGHAGHAFMLLPLLPGTRTWGTQQCGRERESQQGCALEGKRKGLA